MGYEDHIDQDGETEHSAGGAADKGAQADVESDVAAVVADQLLPGVLTVTRGDAGDGWGPGVGAGDGGEWDVGIGGLQFRSAVGVGDRRGVCAAVGGT